MRATLSLVLGAALAALLAGCVCCKQPRCCEVVRVVASEPSLPDGPYARDARQSAWEYLRGKYDADGDGRIAKGEYDRGEDAFARLDKNADGAITEDDLGPGPVHGLMVRMILLQWFQDDANPMVIERAELERGFDAVDANDDGALTSAELKARMDSHAAHVPMLPKPPPGMDPFLSVQMLVDAESKARVRRDAMLAWFDERAKDGAWSPMGNRRRGPPPGGRRPPQGAAVGEPAPDFTLTSPDGDTTVTLSDFRDKRPVALVFGSYT